MHIGTVMKTLPRTIEDYLAILLTDAGIKDTILDEIDPDNHASTLIRLLQTHCLHYEDITEQRYGVDYHELVDAVEDYLELHVSESELINSPTEPGHAIEVCHYKKLVYWVLNREAGWLHYFDTRLDAMEFVSEQI